MLAGVLGVLGVLGALGVLGVTAAAAEPSKPVLMVIYFDNLTGKPEHDVMKKGLAEMVITDLIGYDGITVVERDKLEAALGELHLQDTAAFDPATRVTAGKLVGARYVISGAMLGVMPEVRIDARLTDIMTGADVVAASVRGAPERLFDLEQDLVGKLISSIGAKLTNDAPTRKMKGVGVETVLAYSTGLDLEDKGKLEEARKQYSAVLKKSPTFTLPRERTEKLLKKMVETQNGRSVAMSSAAATLVKAVEQTLAGKFDQLSRDKQDEYLELRAIRGRLLGLTLKQHLITRDSPHVVMRGHEAAARKLLHEIHANFELGRQEFARYRLQHDGSSSVNSDLPRDLDRIASEAHLKKSVEHLDEAARQEAKFVLLGQVEEGEKAYTLGPALGDLDPKLWSETFAMLDREVDSLLRSNKVGAEYEVESALALQAKALFRIGMTEEGIAKLQRFLDQYPTSRDFSHVTRDINIELGVEHSSDRGDVLDYSDKGLKRCEFDLLNRGANSMISHRIAVKGVAGLVDTITEVERACGNHKDFMWHNLYMTFASTAARYGECELSRELWRKFLDHGGSRGDLDGYQKGQPDCVIFPARTPSGVAGAPPPG